MLKQLTLLAFLTATFSTFSQSEEHTIAFYNVDNLFDTLDTKDKNDAEFLPDGKNNWNSEKYNTKIQHINKVFGEFTSPLIIGVCEIENKQVVVDIVNGGALKGTHGVVHTESLDKRGIDNAIIYDSTELTLLEDGVVRFQMPEGSSPSRDIVWAKFSRKKEVIYAMVNHWPSRRGGQDASDSKRLIAATAGKKFIDSLLAADKNVQIVFMGDLNDYPENNAPKLITKTLCTMIRAESGQFGGSYNYRGEWGILDHIMVSKNFHKKKGVNVISKSGKIHSPKFLLSEYKGNTVPFRTFGGGNYLNGYSDHFPVSIKVEF